MGIWEKKLKFICKEKEFLLGVDNSKYNEFILL